MTVNQSRPKLYSVGAFLTYFADLYLFKHFDLYGGHCGNFWQYRGCSISQAPVDQSWLKF